MNFVLCVLNLSTKNCETFVKLHFMTRFECLKSSQLNVKTRRNGRLPDIFGISLSILHLFLHTVIVSRRLKLNSSLTKKKSKLLNEMAQILTESNRIRFNFSKYYHNTIDYQSISDQTAIIQVKMKKKTGIPPLSFLILLIENSLSSPFFLALIDLL